MCADKTPSAPIIVWFRSDLRLADNPALFAAAQSGQPVLPLYILDDEAAGAWKRGAASRWWLHQSLAALDASLRRMGFHPLVCRSGAAAATLGRLIDETGARGVYWNRCYEPWAITRDRNIKEALSARGLDVRSFNAALLFEPWEVVNKTGGMYKVFTPFYKACLSRADLIRAPVDLPARPISSQGGKGGIASGDLDSLGLMPAVRWYDGMAAAWQPGEAGAWQRLESFLSETVAHYVARRDFPSVEGVSHLSPHLHFGEVGPRQIWHAVRRVMAARQGDSGFTAQAQGFLRQLVWREFSGYLLYHFPDLPDRPWNGQFNRFPWRRDETLLAAWRQGRTGYPIVDAGMRQLWRTGWMHNRVRMIAGSFLVKNLLQPWRDGAAWFWDTLVDADLGNNAAGWQWVAGCGVDAAPYFRIFNPVLQGRTFDPDGAYIRRYVPELDALPDNLIHTPWAAPPALRARAGDYPPPVVDLQQSRERALKAYAETKSAA